MSAVVSPPLSAELEAQRPTGILDAPRVAPFLIRIDGRAHGRVHRALWVPGPDGEAMLVPRCGVPMSPRYPAQRRITRVVGRAVTCQKPACRESPPPVVDPLPSGEWDGQEPLW